jgi:hypothetical protein
MTIKNKAESLLLLTRKTPRMFALNCESMMNRVATILEMADIDFVVIDFYEKHLGIYGNTYLLSHEEVKDDWAHQVIDDALQILHKDNK